MMATLIQPSSHLSLVDCYSNSVIASTTTNGGVPTELLLALRDLMLRTIPLQRPMAM